MAKFTGTTKDAGGTFLGAEFWKKGKRIEGQVLDTFQTANGPSYSIRLNKPLQLNGHQEETVSIGNLKGFLMAVRAAGVPGGLQAGDLIVLECTGETPAKKKGFSPQVDFKILVDREDDNKF